MSDKLDQVYYLFLYSLGQGPYFVCKLGSVLHWAKPHPYASAAV